MGRPEPPHPDANDLVDYLEERSVDLVSVAVVEHLVTCAVCQFIVELLADLGVYGDGTKPPR